MNIERLTRIAEWLEGGAKHEHITFDMTKGVAVISVKDYDGTNPNTCDTAVCIAGMAWQMRDEDPGALRAEIKRMQDEIEYAGEAHASPQEIDFGEVRYGAKEFLELSHGQACALFEPHEYGDMALTLPLDGFNDPAWAARVIRHLIATGNVDWKNTRLAP